MFADVKMSRPNEVKTFTNCEVQVWNSINKYKDELIITGVKDSSSGAVFVGDIEGKGKLQKVKFPGVDKFDTQLTFGEYKGKKHVSLLGKLVDKEKKGLIGGFRYFGTLSDDDLSNKHNYHQIGKDEKITVPLGQSKDLIVGITGDSSRRDESGFVSGPLSAFVYDIATDKKRYIVNEHFKSLTATGIVHHDDHTYIICGSASEKALPANADNVEILGSIIGRPYLVEYNSKSHEFKNWRFFGHKDHHEIFSRECQYSGFTSISKSCDDEYQVVANVVEGSADKKPEPYNVASFWGRLHRNECGDFREEKFVLVSSRPCEERRRQYIARGVYHDKFVGLRIKEEHVCKDVHDKFAGFQGKFHVVRPPCECTCERVYKSNYITECWMTGTNRNPYDVSCLYAECERYTECGIIPVVPPNSIPLFGPVVCPNPANPSIVPTVGPNVPLGENLVSDQNAWGPHDVRWRFEGPWNHCGCGWVKDEPCPEVNGCKPLTYPGGYYWKNCGNPLCCWNNTPCRDPCEWYFESCVVHGCPEFRNVSGFAPYGAFPAGHTSPGILDVANDINIGIKLKYNGCGPFGEALCGDNLPKYFTPPVPDAIKNSPCNPFNPASPLNPCNRA